MKRMRRVLLKPQGQVLLATLLFCFIFSVLFAGLYKAGLLYNDKTRASRGADLTVLSGGAVYCNGLQLVRYANIVLVAAIVVDVAKMASAAISAGLFSGGAGALPAARAADILNFRSRVQNIFKPIFGIDGMPGLYPIFIYYETRDAAKHYGLATSFTKSGVGSAVPLPPVLLFSLKTQGQKSIIPTMNLKFRTVGDLLDDLTDVADKEPLYVTYDGSMTFTASQVQPCTRAHPNEMCVKTGTPQYGGKFCHTIEGVDAGSLTNSSVMQPILGSIKWALKVLQPILGNLKLDITHQTKPPDHTLLLYDFLQSQDGKFHQTAEAKIEGPGLAAWDIGAGPFRAKLVSEEFDQIPVIGSLIQKCPGGLDKFDSISSLFP